MMRNRSQRRGAILPLTAVLMIALIALIAFVFDFSQAYAQKNQLQTASDAGAHAGVIELVEFPDGVEDAARLYAGKQPVLGRLLPGGNIDWACGTWDDDTRTFSGATQECQSTHNAVTTTAYDTLHWLWPWWLDGGVKQIAAPATAWLAYVNRAGCVKPWGMMYSLLTTKLDPSNPDVLRVLTEFDLEQLRTLPRDQLRFELTEAQPPTNPGNFGALRLPGCEQAPGSGSQGAATYRCNIAHCNMATQVGEGDWITTEPGLMGPHTGNGVRELCQNEGSLVGQECQGPDGSMGLPVIAVLWDAPPTQQGATQVLVRQLVGFKLDSIVGNVIIGHFRPGIIGGSVGSTPSTLRRPILVE